MIDPLIEARHSNEQHTSPLESVSGLNVSDAMKRFGGNSSIYHRLVLQWIESEADFSVRMSAAMLQQDYQSAAMYLHTLKGTSANLGAMSISDKARELESLIKANPQGERIIEKLGQLSADLSQFFNQLDSIIHIENQKPKCASTQDASKVSEPLEGQCREQEVEPVHVQRMLHELLYFLDNYDTSAIEYAERHYTELDHALGGDRFEVCYKSIHQCDFEVAGKILRQLWPELVQI